MKKEIVYAFIDSQNLNLGIRNDIKRKGRTVYKGWKLDYSRFSTYLRDKYSVTKAFLFIGLIPDNEVLYNKLQQFGYTLVFKPTVEVIKGERPTVKGNVDAELVLHSMIQYPSYDKAIIVSGDGDFHCLIEYLYKKRKLGRILVPNKYSFSSLLWKFYNKVDYIQLLKTRLERK